MRRTETKQIQDEQHLEIVFGITTWLISNFFHEQYPEYGKRQERESQIYTIIRSLINFDLPARRIAHSLLNCPFVPHDIQQTFASQVGYPHEAVRDKERCFADPKPYSVFTYLSAVAAFATPLVPEGFSIKESFSTTAAAPVIAHRFVDALKWALANSFIDFEH